MLPRTVDGMKHVCYFRHALALDERRVKFLPEYAYGGATEPPRTSWEIIQDRKKKEFGSKVNSQTSPNRPGRRTQSTIQRK